MENVILYCRVSSDEQKQGSSLEVQEERLRRYCEQRGYNIIGVYREDESAKTFDKRPEMMKIVSYIKKHRGMVQHLLFLRWDRFSRDLRSAANYQSWFINHGVIPNAIEFEIDHDNELAPLMFAFQVAAAECDNKKRSKATKDGIHGTLKRGKCSNKAPRGYKNVRVSKHDCWVEVDEEKATPIRKAFIEIAKGLICPCEVRRLYCPNIAESSFLELIRNPFYCGKIRVPAYKDEPEQIVEGLHEPIIDEDTFNKVQDILSGKKRKNPKIDKTVNPELYLRKFLVCPICGCAVTGSRSKGRNQYYTYYHCNDSKHLRVPADKVNCGFVDYISRLIPNDEVLELYQIIIDDIRQQSSQNKRKELNKLTDDFHRLEDRLVGVEDKYIDGDLDKDTFQRIKNRIANEMREIKSKLELIKDSHKNISPQLKYSLSLIKHLDEVFINAPVEAKVKLLGSMFPEKIEFDGENYRTTSYNKVLDLIYQNTNELRGAAKEKAGLREENPASVP